MKDIMYDSGNKLMNKVKTEWDNEVINERMKWLMNELMIEWVDEVMNELGY